MSMQLALFLFPPQWLRGRCDGRSWSSHFGPRLESCMLRMAEPSHFGMTFLDCYVRNKYDSDLVRHCVLGLLVLQLTLSLHNYTPATDELVSWLKIQNRNMHYFAFFPPGHTSEIEGQFPSSIYDGSLILMPVPLHDFS